jgi:hypothetical protein
MSYIIKKSALSYLVKSSLVSELKSHRAPVLWSRWLYGSPMWTEEDCTDVDNDLACLVEIRDHCSHVGGTDFDAVNACFDAIRQILFSDARSPSNPLEAMTNDVTYVKSKLFKMLVDVLVYGTCASNGKTRDWLHKVDGEYPKFFTALSHEFAKKVRGEAPPDLMARCAYHVHPKGSKCDDVA